MSDRSKRTGSPIRGSTIPASGFSAASAAALFSGSSQGCRARAYLELAPENPPGVEVLYGPLQIGRKHVDIAPILAVLAVFEHGDIQIRKLACDVGEMGIVPAVAAEENPLRREFRRRTKPTASGSPETYVRKSASRDGNIP